MLYLCESSIKTVDKEHVFFRKRAYFLLVVNDFEWSMKAIPSINKTVSINHLAN